MSDVQWSRRAFFKRSAVLGAVAVAGPGLLAACTSTSSGNTLENAKKNKVIKVGIAGEQPYGFTDSSGKLTGEAPEVAKAVFKALGIDKVDAQQVAFDSLIPGLNAKQFDMVAAGMNITPKRCKSATFSLPDYSALTALLVPKGNPKGLTNFQDVATKKAKIAVLSAAVEKDFATGAGVAAGQITTLATQDDMLRAVTDKRVDCAALTDISFKWLVKQNANAAVEVTKGFVPEISGKPQVSAGGFVFRKADKDLVDAFNTELKKLHGNGQWLTIVQPFGFTQDNLVKPDLTTEKLCTA
ncbi:ectoine/hydroxyectoine ABC transporter substrate-binding protein EhuB [Fodinicola acaciae]|uniref:ectoine/hydroxyectoine ABC transporter substrate-binding protein EhuB n=1 Tax=Fodinicola acaciae TaxID=2681555 RepID=UPI0013D417DB|nr:ectoine/hydroxyectoine ABC transporter substrate-binding protein EhuB [Fodinicola acaciae]